MNLKNLKTSFFVLLLLVVSCDEPETVVTNYIHTDGSVTRRIEMRNVSAKFDRSKFQVPFDSTWSIKDSIEISAKGDTTWVKRAEKLFASVDDINNVYKTDTTGNSKFTRTAAFTKSFRWFNTIYRFSETIDRQIQNGYPVSDFLNAEELSYFYSPGSLRDEQGRSSDSLKYRSLADSVNKKSEKWMLYSIFSEWISDFSKLTEGKGGKEMISKLRQNEAGCREAIEKKYNEKFDSLWEAGVILRDFVGEENAIKFRTEADSAISMATGKLFNDFKDYSLRIVMPGRLTGTNGYIDSSRMLLWPVASDYFLTQPYEMWAESKVTNTWAWIVSAVFLLFVLTGIIIKTKKG
jgi:hypothetical protein